MASLGRISLLLLLLSIAFLNACLGTLKSATTTSPVRTLPSPVVNPAAAPALQSGSTSRSAPSPTAPLADPTATKAIESPSQTPKLTTLDNTNTPETQGAAIKASITAGGIRAYTWSPDSQWLAYWTFTPEEAKRDFDYPPGVLHFLNAQSGQTCESGYGVGYGYFAMPLDWLADGHVLLVTSDGDIRLGSPCKADYVSLSTLLPVKVDSIATHNQDRNLFLLHSVDGLLLFDPQSRSVRPLDNRIKGGVSGYTWSPKSTRLGFTSGRVASPFEAVTYIVDVKTGKLEQAVPWQATDAIGVFAGPTWLNEDQFLIQYTLDRGPLLVTIGKETAEVAPKLFNQTTAPTLQAVGQIMAGTSNYHVALYSLENRPAKVLLFHSENRMVEELPFGELEFSPSGSTFVGYDDTGRFWARSVDPIGSEAKLFLKRGIGGFPVSWSASGDRLAAASENEILVFSIPGGERIGNWKVQGYTTIPGDWSLDGKYLVVRGDRPAHAGAALFVIEVPNKISE